MIDMPRRKSDEVYERIKKLPVADKGKAIRLWAATYGMSQRDLVGKIVEITGAKTSEQIREISQTWARLLDLTPDRFVELAKDFL